MKKETNGITLIALVVTIVVLLILAGVSINMVLGQNGIVTKAKEARDKTEQAKQNDLASMDQVVKDMDDILNDNGISGGDDTETKTLVEAFNAGELNIGDYVEYKPTAGQTYTSVTGENGWADQTYTVDTTTTWRVLGLSDDGSQVLLTSGSPIKKDMDASSENDWDKNPYLYMKGAYAYVNCEKMLNDICAIYSTDLGIARSMTIEDVNKVCGVKAEGNTVYLASDTEKNNIDQAGIRREGTYTYTASDYTPASYIDGKKNATAGKTVIAAAYSYDITSMKNKTIGKENVTLGSLLFDKTTDDDNYVKSYWLASPGVSVVIFPCYGTYVYFGPGYVESNAGIGKANFKPNGSWYAGRLAVRPVISLKSDVTTVQVKKLANQTEDDWSGYTAQWDCTGNADTGEAGNHGN
mgnify:CR=1 FL=1